MFTKRGIKFNDERLARLSLEVLDELEAIGLKPYKLESITLRTQNKKFGCCHTEWYKSTGEIISNKITINRQFVEQNTTDKALKCVIAHEAIHAMKECLHCGHVGKWAEYADLINDCYNMNIQQYGSYEEYGMTAKPKTEYKWKCSACGQTFTHKGYRAPKWYMHPKGYTHTHCPSGKKGYVMSEYYNYKLI